MLSLEVVNTHFGPTADSTETDNRFSRLKTAIERAGGNADVARRAKVGTTTISTYINGHEWKFGIIEKIAEACGVEAKWIFFGEDNYPQIQKVNSSEDVLVFSKYEVAFSAGDGTTAISEDQSGSVSIPKGLLSPAIIRKQAFIVAVNVSGDSMTPTLEDGDLILVDRSVDRLVSGQVYAIRNEDELLVKRLERTLDGDIAVISDNPRYEKQIVSAERARQMWSEGESPLRIIGRVVWRQGTLGNF